MKGIVIVQYDEDGDVSYHVAGDEIRFFIVDERAPGDRVYEWLSRDDADAIAAILRDDAIGSSADERHEAIKRKVLRALDGKRHLEPVR